MGILDEHLIKKTFETNDLRGISSIFWGYAIFMHLLFLPFYAPSFVSEDNMFWVWALWYILMACLVFFAFQTGILSLIVIGCFITALFLKPCLGFLLSFFEDAESWEESRRWLFYTWSMTILFPLLALLLLGWVLLLPNQETDSPE